MIVVCVHYGTKYPVEYVNTLNSMVKRHSDATLICLTDTKVGKDMDIGIHIGETDFEGWWNKIQLFNPNFLKGERFLYLDLDVVITEDITSILSRTEPFVTIQDWIYDTYNSSAMLMTGGEHSHVYDLFIKDKDKAMQSCPQGDQQWITNYVKADFFNDGDFASFRMSSCEQEPKGKIVVFHGKPDPHEVKGTWVEENWCE